MQKHPDITRQRVKAFASDTGLGGLIYPDSLDVQLSVFSAQERIPYREAINASYSPARPGQVFGPAWSTHWFRVEARVPQEWAGKEVHFLWDSSSEACVWVDGQPRQGLTGSGANPAERKAIRPAYRLTHSARGGEPVNLYVEMACNTLFGQQDAFEYALKRAAIAVFDRQAWDLLWDFTLIADMANQLPPESPRAGQALYAANQMVNLCRLEDRSTWEHARAIAADFFTARNGDGQHNLSAIGHAHLDTAWLWPLAETKRKVVRTFTNALRLMEDYPDFKFTHSQAQQFAWVKEHHPALYAEIRERVKEGRLIPAGGSWVEPDCNLPSGESLVRQFLYGQRFFKAEFGEICREFWNPDVFGYSAALPQIMRGAGIRYFLTQKLSWNQFNKPANQTFLWEGLDGSQVLTHFPPGDTYNSLAGVADVLFSVKNFKEHDRSRESYLLFGYGDGGGGPTPEMLEQLGRMKDLDGLPRVEIRGPQEFFSRCEQDLKDPAVWVGELYFEYHRGTYTTQASNKRDNRRSELLLRDLELLAALNLAAGRPEEYPAVELERLWKLVLLNQFHDILPGSSITQVYRDSNRDYNEVQEQAGGLRAKALQEVCAANPERPGEAAETLVAFNTLSSPRREVVEIPAEMAAGLETAQSSAGGRLALVDAPAMGWSPIETGLREGLQPASVRETQAGFILENGFLRVGLTHGGQLTSLYDLQARREVLPPGSLANRFVLFDDNPLNFEAWDVDIFHLEKRRDVAPAHTARVTENGPLRASVEFETRISPGSYLKQTVSLTCVSPRLDFDTWVDWHEKQVFLKVEFPFQVRAELATYEIQFGHVQRPTHYNTSYDLARFEVCAHRWADFSEHGYGVALLNDCKYGYSAYQNVMRLSLLRGSFSQPDPTSDQGQHRFRYALLPHSGSLQEAGVIAEGYRFNVPLLLARSTRAQAGPFFEVDQPAVVIDTVKKAEDSRELILRLYESFGGRWPVRLKSSLPVISAVRCNLLEEEVSERLEWPEDGLEMDLQPFELLTIKLRLAEPHED